MSSSYSRPQGDRMSNYKLAAKAVALTPVAAMAGVASADVYSNTGLSITVTSTTANTNFEMTGAGGATVRTFSAAGGGASYASVKGNGLRWMGIDQRIPTGGVGGSASNWFGGLPVSAGATWNNLGRTAGEFTGTNNSITTSAGFGDINWGKSSSGGFADDPQGVGNTGQTWYLLFKTTGSDGYEGNYGWLSFDAYADGTTNSYITITGWGWDDAGSTIAAGQTAGSTAVPGLGGLAALAIGAGGLRGRRQRATAS
ncbi:MAG: hypothetical protein P8P71_09180 [Phycisphaerales bacterium]|nr:hypothetical protein [Phycisphaerales bacterium]